MTQKLFEVLSHRHEKRDKDKPWVFWQRYWDQKEKRWVEGPYQDRKKFMKTLCKKANEYDAAVKAGELFRGIENG